ncbi:hypothetical protein OROMI_012772 [Orobanche minor]
MLLKLVVVFGPVITSTISSAPTVGVDLHAEKRLECCNKCHVELQKIQKSLPIVIRRGGLTARSAQELNCVIRAFRNPFLELLRLSNWEEYDPRFCASLC